MTKSSICSIDGCDKPFVAKSFCCKHYTRLIRHGDPLYTKPIRPKLTCSIQDCGKPVEARSYCIKHYKRLLKHGDPLAGGTEKGEPLRWLRESLAKETDNCIIWPYGVFKSGYGGVYYEGRTQKAHRIALILHSGEPSDTSLQACHAPKICHNPLCVNVRAGHIFWGTHAENMKHKLLDGTDNRGGKHGGAKLTESQVSSIRADTRADHIIAADYRVSRRTVNGIKRRKSWTHID